MSLAGTYYNARSDSVIEVMETFTPDRHGRHVRKVYHRFNECKSWSLIVPAVLERHIEVLNYKKIPDKELYEELLWE